MGKDHVQTGAGTSSALATIGGAGDSGSALAIWPSSTTTCVAIWMTAGASGAGRRRDTKTPAPTGSSIQPSRSYVHAPFANPRAKSCWLSCAFQVLWHSRAWHTCFEAALEAGALETSEWDTPGAPKQP